MIRIMRYLSGHIPAAFIIILFMIIQAFCEIALPTYTSNIVDVGIQQQGIENAAPVKIRESSFDDLSRFMTDDEIAEFKTDYDLVSEDISEQGGDSERVYVINTNGKENAEQISKILSAPMAMSMNPTLSSDMAENSQMESMVSQTAVEYVRVEYEALGIDIDGMQIDYLKKTGGMMLLFSVIMMLAAIMNSFLASRVGSSIGRDLRARIFKKVLSFSGSEIDKFSTASLITRCTNDIQQIQMVCIMLLRMVLYAPIIGIAGVIMVSRTNTGMTWIIIIAVIAIICLVSGLMRLALPKFKIMQTLIDRLNLISREILTGIPVIRAFNRQAEEEKRFDGANRDLMRTQLFTNRVMTLMMPAMMMIMNGVSILIIWQGSKSVDMGSLQVGDMIAFITYTMLIVMAFLVLTMISIMLPRAGVAAARIDEVLNTEVNINDPETPLDENINSFDGEIRFENVSFKYPGAEENVLENVSFTAKAHRTTAVIGSTGSGKSTIVNLIPRFYDVTEGRITIDGIDIRDISQHKLREAIGLIPQKGILFSGTIESNLKFADNSISDELMREAAETAQAVEFIESREERYESSVSQNGSNVSGGQRQRLAIARAIAKRPAVYLFDDSFSALDYKTDAKLRKALSESVYKATNIIVAQRISTIMHADQIIVLDEGRVVGAGTHEELLRSCSEYREIADSQLSEAELEGGAQ
ncbi:MAG: ABC transporter ATP-binding protein [Firmicutes bacterium]|nr:ABC transporter ATP-binding protein [Bacillota bacterium]